MVLLKVADERCRLQEAEAYAWPRRVRAGAVRGGPDGSVVLWHCGTNPVSSVFLERMSGVCMTVLWLWVGSNEYV